MALKMNYKKSSEGIKKASDKILKSVLKIASPYIRMTVTEETKNPKVGQATTKILNSMSVAKFYSLTNTLGN